MGTTNPALTLLASLLTYVHLETFRVGPSFGPVRRIVCHHQNADNSSAFASVFHCVFGQRDWRLGRQNTSRRRRIYRVAGSFL
jgi:hypothetical protein